MPLKKGSSNASVFPINLGATPAGYLTVDRLDCSPYEVRRIYEFCEKNFLIKERWQSLNDEKTKFCIAYQFFDRNDKRKIGGKYWAKFICNGSVIPPHILDKELDIIQTNINKGEDI